MDENPHDINLLAAYLEDRLAEQEKKGLVEHLAVCPECRATLAMLARGADLLPRPVAAGSASRVSRWPLPVRVWLPLAATLVLAVAALTRFPSPKAVVPGETMGRPASPSLTPPASSPPAGDRGAPPREARVPILRGPERKVAGKTFHLVFGEWIDTAFDPASALPSVDVKTSEESSALLARIPALAPYAALGERVLVVHQGTVYRFGARPPR